MIQGIVNQFWYNKPSRLTWLLYPMTGVYCVIVWIRRWVLTRFFQTEFDVPVIVVGNLTVGGVGKTPLVIALAEHLGARGRQVGIVSRGYGASIKKFPYQVQLDDTPSQVGHEPLLLAKKTGVPVVIAPKRVEAIHYLLQQNKKIDVVLSDDGLQHYRMARAVEILVVDGQRGFGNGLCLPAGPLREPKQRIKHADFVVVNGDSWDGAYRMDLVPGVLYPEKIPGGLSVAAFAGIGHPERFFDTLTDLKIKHRPYRFPDHHRFVLEDFKVPEDIVVMTEKDAIKCQGFLDKPMYVLPVWAEIKDNFWEKLDAHDCFQE